MGPPALCAAVTSVRQWTTFCGISPLQEAVAVGFEDAASHNYFNTIKQDFQRKRDALVKILESAGLMCCVPQGGYFVMANTHGLRAPQAAGGDTSERQDTAWCKWLTTQGVTSIPPSAFYSDEHAHMAAGWARFAFCKQVPRLLLAAAHVSLTHAPQDSVIEAAGERLKALAALPSLPQ